MPGERRTATFGSDGCILIMALAFARAHAYHSLCLCCVQLFGIIASALGGAGIVKGGTRVLVGGSLSMAVTFAVGACFGTRVA